MLLIRYSVIISRSLSSWLYASFSSIFLVLKIDSHTIVSDIKSRLADPVTLILLLLAIAVLNDNPRIKEIANVTK